MTGSALIRKALAARAAADAVAPLIGQFTPAERRVARLLAEGQRNREIGLALGKSENTVKQQVAGILRKLGLPNRGRATAALHSRLDLF